VTDRNGRDVPGLRVLDGMLAPNVAFVVTTREAGASIGAFARGNVADHVGDQVSAVTRNRTALQQALGAARGLAVIAAEHGGSCSRVHEAGIYGPVDALITDTPGLGLVALGADCAVIGIAGRRLDGTSVAGVAHCGWRGLVADILGSLVRGMVDAGGQNLQAVVGPTICGSCYPVDQVRAERVIADCTPGVVEATVQVIASTGGAVTHHLDIQAGVHQRLTELGVDISVAFGCTAEDERWFSHRASIAQWGAGAVTGRHALGVVIGPESVAVGAGDAIDAGGAGDAR
jgi:YfiH family protein